MSTTRHTQERIGEYGVHEFELGDCLRDQSETHNSSKITLIECPLCATDPTRPRYFFNEQESRPAHIVAEHSE